MKVYELMDLLAKHPAGAEVRVGALMTSEALEDLEVLEQTEAGENIYQVTGVIEDVDKTNDHCVNIYINMGMNI